MVGTRDKTLIKNELIRYISSLGIEVKTETKARGNKGFFKEGRIDISKTLDDESAVKTIVHEFTHYINYKLDKKLKSLEILFGEESQEIKEELLSVTMFVDKNSNCEKLNKERENLKAKIEELLEEIKSNFPDYSADEDLKEFKRYAKGTDLIYLEKYDKVKVRSWKSDKTYSLSDIKTDFPDIPDVFVAYLNLKSKQRKRAKISRRITKLNKYYNEPCELFARFVEGIYLDIDKVKELAPNTYEKFLEKYNSHSYKFMPELFSILGVIIW